MDCRYRSLWIAFFFGRYRGLPEELSGVVVADLAPQSPASAVLRTEDILLSLDGCPISNEGTVTLSNQVLQA